MARNIIIVILYHHQKLLYLMFYFYSECVLKLRGEDSVGSDSASHASSATNTTRDSRRKASKRYVSLKESLMHVQSGAPRHKHCTELIGRYLVPDKFVLLVVIQTTAAADRHKCRKMIVLMVLSSINTLGLAYRTVITLGWTEYWLIELYHLHS